VNVSDLGWPVLQTMEAQDMNTIVFSVPRKDYEDKCGEYEHRVTALLPQVQDTTSKYHSRAEGKELHQELLRLAAGTGGWARLRSNEKSALLRLILDDDSADAAKVEKEFQILIDFAVASADDDFIADLRQIGNNGGKTKFTVFFAELKKMLEEKNMIATQDRRHSTIPHLAVQTGGRQRLATDANGFAPDFISVRHLREEVTQRVPEGTPIPSESTVLMAFCHPNPTVKAAQRYTGCVGISYTTQSRQLHKFHLDFHHQNNSRKMGRQFCAMYRPTRLEVDDKAAINVGEPEQPLQAVARNRKGITGDKNCSL